MTFAHEIILIAGVLGLVSILAGLLSARFGAPLLLVFLVLGMLAGEEGPGGIVFDDFPAAYVVGSAALAIILFEGGLKTERAMIEAAFWPALALATVGVAVTAGVVGAAAILLLKLPPVEALLIGAVVAPTDAAAVALLLRRAQVALPFRVTAALEIESGLNDPISVFLTLLLVGMLGAPVAALLLLEEMGGGAALGLAAGYLCLALFRRLRAETSLYPVLALAAALTLFGGAQSLGASGFLAVYLLGVVVGSNDHRAGHAIERFFEAFAWLAQIALFLMLGLLVNPHELVPLILPMLILAVVLILLARPLAAFLCLLPFRFALREASFVSWVGLRGAVPIYLAIIPVLAGAQIGNDLFGASFVIVLVSLLAQGWTIGAAARLLGFAKSSPDATASPPRAGG